MFIINTEIEVNWYLPATAIPYVFSDFDVMLKAPDGSQQYIESALLEDDFIAPTVDTTGSATYRFTPDQKGVWVIILTIGDSSNSTVYFEYYMQVHENDTHIYQQFSIG